MFENLQRMKKQIKAFFAKRFVSKKVQHIVMTDISPSESPRKRIQNIYRIQQENNKKLNAMNEKIARTIRRIEEVKNKMANIRLNEAEKNSFSDEITDDPTASLKHRPLPKLPFKEFSEFVDLHEFIKFNKMGSITEEEIQTCNWDETLKRLCS